MFYVATQEACANKHHIKATVGHRSVRLAHDPVFRGPDDTGLLTTGHRVRRLFKITARFDLDEHDGPEAPGNDIYFTDRAAKPPG